jgi:hypothetical protein
MAKDNYRQIIAKIVFTLATRYRYSLVFVPRAGVWLAWDEDAKDWVSVPCGGVDALCEGVAAELGAGDNARQLGTAAEREARSDPDLSAEGLAHIH